MIKNTENKYGSIAKLLHWSIGLLIIGLIGVGFYMTDLPPSDSKWFVYGMHKATGMVVLTLVTIRVLWRYMGSSPDLPDGMPLWQQKAARWTHYALYSMMVIMPLSGMVMSLMTDHPIDMFGLFTIPAIAKEPGILAGVSYLMHTYVPYILIAIISLHFAAALYHHFVRKDDVLRRMLP